MLDSPRCTTVVFRSVRRSHKEALEGGKEGGKESVRQSVCEWMVHPEGWGMILRVDRE